MLLTSSTTGRRKPRVLTGRSNSGFYPEGTFNETGEPLKDFYDGAFRTAVETQTPIKPILFVDNNDRLCWRSIFSLTPGICRCVYLDEIAVDGYTTKEEIQILKKTVFIKMEEGLVRYRKPKPSG